MGWIAAATVAWIGVDLVSAWDTICTRLSAMSSRLLLRAHE
jgi:hypothetical protein